MEILIGIILLFVVLSMYFLQRNDAAFIERLRIIKLIGIAVDNDTINGKPWEWRYDEYGNISQNKMVFTFWKPIKSFYQDSKCYKEE